MDGWRNLHAVYDPRRDVAAARVVSDITKDENVKSRVTRERKFLCQLLKTLWS